MRNLKTQYDAIDNNNINYNILVERIIIVPEIGSLAVCHRPTFFYSVFILLVISIPTHSLEKCMRRGHSGFPINTFAVAQAGDMI